MLKSNSSKRWHVGKFELVSAGGLLAEKEAEPAAPDTRGLKFSNTVGDVRSMHAKYAAASSVAAPTTLIQAASQFNCLEMVGPSIMPEVRSLHVQSYS